MPVTFNPFNPLSYWAAFALPSKPKDTSPIAISPRNSDPGLQVTESKNAITIRGVTRGAQHVDSFLGGNYEVARGMSFTLDIDKAKTVDAFGRTNYTEKNHRIFTLDTARGWSAEECARRLAAKVNAGDAPFDAKVTIARDGAATITFERR